MWNIESWRINYVTIWSALWNITLQFNWRIHFSSFHHPSLKLWWLKCKWFPLFFGKERMSRATFSGRTAITRFLCYSYRKSSSDTSSYSKLQTTKSNREIVFIEMIFVCNGKDKEIFFFFFSVFDISAYEWQEYTIILTMITIYN